MQINNQFQIDRYNQLKEYLLFGILAERVREFNHMVEYVEKILKILA